MDMINNGLFSEIDNELEIFEQYEEHIYPMNDIKVEKGFYTIFELKRRFDAPDKRIILDSDFQRDDVWDDGQKAELVESVLMGLPLPIFYFNQDKYGKIIVVDGRQRLTALFSYMNDKYPLKKLRILPELNNLKFSQLSPVLMSRIEDYQIQAHVIMPPTPDRIKFDIFDRVNRGGTKLNKQEIRNALYQGKATSMLNDIVSTKIFKNATGGAFLKEKRMKDKYLITRALTLILYCEGRVMDDYGDRYVYRGDLDDFLGRGMDAINSMDTELVECLRIRILTLLELSFYYLGKDAFRLSYNGRRTPVNMNVFETIMMIMDVISTGENYDKDSVANIISGFMQKEEFIENIGNHRDSATKLQWRIDYAKKIGEDIKITC